jgi:hypothetical protein
MVRFANRYRHGSTEDTEVLVLLRKTFYHLFRLRKLFRVFRASVAINNSGFAAIKIESHALSLAQT